jgi:hypothetical protein
MFSGRYGLCCMQAGRQTDCCIIIRGSRLWLGKSGYAIYTLLTKLSAYPIKNAISNSMLADKIIIWHLSAFCL